MGIYYLAVDENEKKRIEPPSSFANKTPGLYHPENPFPAMVTMMNTRGWHYQIINDSSSWYEVACEYEDITEEVYQDLLNCQPTWKELVK